MTRATASTTLDVRGLAPGERHPTIVAAFRALDFGDVLEIVNDCDPRPLYYQFQVASRGTTGEPDAVAGQTLNPCRRASRSCST